MPIYEYRCKSCGQHLEIIQKVGEAPRRKCEKCGGRLEKLISRTAFVLKGGGWYSEGYSHDGGTSKSTKSESKEPKKESKKDSKKASQSSDGSGGKQSAAAN